MTRDTASAGAVDDVINSGCREGGLAQGHGGQAWADTASGFARPADRGAFFFFFSF